MFPVWHMNRTPYFLHMEESTYLFFSTCNTNLQKAFNIAYQRKEVLFPLLCLEKQGNIFLSSCLHQEDLQRGSDSNKVIHNNVYTCTCTRACAHTHVFLSTFALKLSEELSDANPDKLSIKEGKDFLFPSAPGDRR